MIYSSKLHLAINFAIKVHQLDQNQMRKGKTVPYIIHPLAVGLILAKAGANEDVICAGILHDTIEDCEPYGSVTKESIATMFGSAVAEMVNDVTEQDKNLPWEERKRLALEHIKDMGEDSTFVKSADLLHNMSDQLTDYQEKGDALFVNFNASKEKQLSRYQNVIAALEQVCPENPLLPDLQAAYQEIDKLWS